MGTPKNVLYINGNILKRGGIEAFMMNYFRHIDSSKVHIDFLVHGYEKGAYDDEITKAGSKIIHVPTKSRHPIKYQKELKKIFASGQYQIVHSHCDAMSGMILRIAAKCGVPVRIAHSHNTATLTDNKIKLAINEYSKRLIPRYATHMFACSEAAGDWMFGNGTKYTVINNAIDIDKFKFNQIKRDKIRKELDCNDKFVIGHVGRFDYQKNQEFIISLLPRLQAFRNNLQVVFVGEGESLERIKDLARDNNVEDICIFLGSRSDVSDLYNAFDVFVLPSRFEGLGIVAIEAQANGLSCYVSDNLPTDVKICPNLSMISLLDEEEWVRQITSCEGKRISSNYEEIERAGYSIEKKAIELQAFYENVGIEDIKRGKDKRHCAYI
jgi:glycosyltransferase involved in cell wall biosynthesis